MKNQTVRLQCPKCRHFTLRKSIGKNMVDREYYCDHEHIYFGIHELVNQWGWDLGDFYVDNNTQLSLEEFSTLHKKEKCKHLTTVNYPLFIPEIFQHSKQWVECGKLLPLSSTPAQLENWWNLDTVSPIDEPQWKSVAERDYNYETVNEMLMGIEAWEDMGDYLDLKETQECALDRGIQ